MPSKLSQLYDALTALDRQDDDLVAVQVKLRELRDKHKRQGFLSPNDLSLANRLAQTEPLLVLL